MAYLDIGDKILAQRRAQRAQEEARNNYALQKEELDNKYDPGLGGFLGGIVGSIGKGIGDVGKGIFDLLGTGVAATRDLGSIITTGQSAGEQDKFQKWLYGTDDTKDAWNKAAGTTLNAATTLATTALPATGAGSALGKAAASTAANTAAGAIGGVADELQYQGKDANIESATNRALSGAAAGLATGALGSKIGNATSKTGSALLNNKIATSTLGRGALSGAVGGSVGAGTSAALAGQDVGQAALQGALTGAGAGAAQAGVMRGVNAIGQKVRNNAWESGAIKNRVNSDDTFKRIKNGDDSVTNSDVLKKIGATLSDTELDMYKRALNGETLSREEIQNTPIVKKFKEYADSNDNPILTNDQEKGRAPIDSKTMRRLQKAADTYMDNDASLKNAKNEGNAVIVLGLPASGKSSNVVDRFANQGYFNLDNDNIKKLFPEYNNGLGAGNVHGASSYVSNELVLPKVASNKTNVVIPVIGKGLNSLEKYATMLKNAGYGNIDLVNVSLPADKTATRNFTRMLETSRNVDMDYIYDVVGNKPTENYNLIKERINNGTEPNFTGYSTISTDVPFGNAARIIENRGRIQLPGEFDTGSAVGAGSSSRSSGSVPEGVQTGRVLGQNQPNDVLAPNLMYGESQLGNRTKRGIAADAISRLGNTLEGAQSNVTRAAARDLGIESTGKAIEEVRKVTGLTNLETQAALAREITGGENSLMDAVQRQALTATEDGRPFSVDTTEIENAIPKIVNSITDDNVLDTASVIQTLRRTVGNNDSDTISIANRLKDQAADLRGKGITDPPAKDKALAKIYTEIAKRLDDLSYKAIPEENVEAMFDATIGEMRGRAQQAQNNNNADIATAYNKMADALDAEPRTIGAFRGFKKRFVDASKISRLTGQAENGAAIQMGQSFVGGLRRGLNTMLQRPVNSGLAKLGGAVNDLAERVATSGDNTTTQAATTPIQPMDPDLQRILGNYLGRSIGAQDANNNIQNLRKQQEYQELEDAYSDVLGANMGLDGGYGMTQQNTAANSQLIAQMETISGAMNNALAAGDMKAYSQLTDLYKDAYDIYKAQTQSAAKSDLSTAEKNQIAKLQSAGSALDELESLYQKAGGGQGIIGGNIANFLGGLGLNSDVNTYNQLAQGLINQIGAAIGKTDSLNTEGEVQRALSLVPKITDDNQTAMNKLESLRKLLQTNTGTYNQLYQA